jgi:hypothetical protein
MAAPAGEDKDVDAFLADCTASGDAAYGAAKAVLERLHAPATRPAARRLLGAVRRRFAADPAAGEDCFRTFHFRIHDVVLDPHVQGAASCASTSLTATDLLSRLGGVCLVLINLDKIRLSAIYFLFLANLAPMCPCQFVMFSDG